MPGTLEVLRLGSLGAEPKPGATCKWLLRQRGKQGTLGQDRVQLECSHGRSQPQVALQTRPTLR